MSTLAKRIERAEALVSAPVDVPRGTEGSTPRCLARLWRPHPRGGAILLEGVMTLADGSSIRVALLAAPRKRRPTSPDYLLVAA